MINLQFTYQKHHKFIFSTFFFNHYCNLPVRQTQIFKKANFLAKENGKIRSSVGVGKVGVKNLNLPSCDDIHSLLHYKDLNPIALYVR
jgi:hypothetical protein